MSAAALACPANKNTAVKVIMAMEANLDIISKEDEQDCQVCVDEVVG